MDPVPGSNATNPINQPLGGVKEASVWADPDRVRQMMQFSVEHASDAIFWLGAEGQILYANPAATSALGYSRDELQSMNILDIEVGLPREAWPEHWAALKQRGSMRIEGCHRTKDGRLLDVEVSASFAAIDGQEFNFAYARDITERKQAEVALQESEARFRTMTEWLPLPMHLIRDGKLIYANRASARDLGVPPNESMVGQSVLSFVAPAFHSVIQARMGHVLEDGEANPPISVQFLKFDGTPLDVEGHSVALTFQGKPATCVIWQDITARKTAEEMRLSLEAQLRESQKMEAIGTLAGGIAHDFNNIIATILGNAHLALLDPGVNREIEVSLDEVCKAARRARDLVQQILSFGRREPTRRTPIDLNTIVEESARLLRATLPARLSLTAECQNGVPPVLADATQIQQVLINLATNAMQAMRGETGHIALRLDTVNLDQALVLKHPELRQLFKRHPGLTVRLTVQDDGRGMSKETVQHIFEPFFTTKPLGEGTGLGLSVVYSIVASHEGAIGVDSALGQGTSFHVYLGPFASHGGEQNPSDVCSEELDSTPPLAGEAGKHILYLDDDASVAHLVKRMLERMGHRVSAFTNQAQALDTLRQDPNRFDLVLSDYNMPGQSGLDVAREVRIFKADLPVAIVSGFIDEQLRVQATDAGVRAVLFKAADFNAFFAAIQALLAKP
jgi:PAS domain S-box-containing protein